MSTRTSLVFLGAFLALGCSSNGSSDSAAPRTLPAYCSGGDIRTLTLPWYWGQAGSPTFSYRYQLRPGSSPAAPTVVALPGGPGGQGISSTPLIGAIPSTYNVVYTDARGTGCNASTSDPDFPLDFYKTEYLARDVLAAIADLSLQNYYIYGRSYGTVQATVLAYIIKQQGYTAPKGVILEATLGKAFSTYANYLANGQGQWARVQPSIDPGVLGQITGNMGYLGYSSSQWARLILTALGFGQTFAASSQGEYIVLLLNPLANPGSASGQTSSAIIAALLSAPADSASPIGTGLGCRELWGTLTGADLIGGNIVGAGPDSCAAAGLSLSAPWDAASYPLDVPIFYFHGQYDSASPLAGAQYHYDHQTTATRNFVTVGSASHHPLDQTLNTRGCSDAVWTSVISNPPGLRAALDLCAWPYTLVP